MDTDNELYCCTVCTQPYWDFLEAIFCCEDVDKLNENFYTIQGNWSDIT